MQKSTEMLSRTVCALPLFLFSYDWHYPFKNKPQQDLGFIDDRQTSLDKTTKAQLMCALNDVYVIKHYRVK